MASKKPPQYPSRFQQVTDFARSAADAAGKAVSDLEEYLGTPEDVHDDMNIVQKELSLLKGSAKGTAYAAWVGVKKIGRGIFGVAAGVILPIAGAFTGIRPNEVNSLIGSLNTAGGVTSLWKKFKELSSKHSRELAKMTLGQRLAEYGKRAGSLIVNPIVGGLSGFFNTCIANILGAAATIAGGFGRVQENLSKTMVYKLAEKTTPFGGVANAAGDASKLISTVLNTSNLWGKIAAGLAKWDIVKKYVSPETLKLWTAYGDDESIAAANGDKEIIAQMVKKGIMNVVGSDPTKALGKVASYAGGFAKRLGASEHHLEQIKRLAKGDIGALNEVVKNFIPGFDIKDAKSFMNFTSTVKQTFTTAVTQIGTKYIPGADFEKVTVRMTDMLGFKGAALEGMKKKLGDKVLGENFETIRAKGNKMVAAASDFVKNIADPNLREKMGYTMAAGSVQAAIAALVKQNASPDFIGKIHTFKLRDGVGQGKILDPSALAAFKDKALAEVAKLSDVEKPVITAAKPKPTA